MVRLIDRRLTGIADWPVSGRPRVVPSRIDPPARGKHRQESATSGNWRRKSPGRTGPSPMRNHYHYLSARSRWWHKSHTSPQKWDSSDAMGMNFCKPGNLEDLVHRGLNHPPLAAAACFAVFKMVLRPADQIGEHGRLAAIGHQVDARHYLTLNSSCAPSPQNGRFQGALGAV